MAENGDDNKILCFVNFGALASVKIRPTGNAAPAS